MLEETQHRRKSFSQFGEDGVLQWIFHDRRNGFYVDVGCHHPFRFSNTANLYLDMGWKGVNIDVDERAIEAFQKHRPNDTNILMGIADTTGQMEITLFEEGAINSFDPTSANHPAWAHIPREKKVVPVETLGNLLRQHIPGGTKIDLLNIDVEGLDYQVLSANDWRSFKPDVIAVEISDIDLGSVVTHRTYNLLINNGYRLSSHVALTSIFQLVSS